MLLREFKADLYQAIIDLLWRQWSSLGIAGQVDTPDNGLVLDPEALLIFSARFCRYDQRLYDLLPDWLCRFGSLVNTQRLRALYDSAAWRDTNSLGFLAAAAASRAGGRWQKIASNFCSALEETPVAMFRDWATGESGFIPKPDALALHYGFLRNEFRFSGKVSPQLPTGAATMLLKMRSLLGVSARAETLLILFDRGVCRIQEIADSSGFAWKSIQDVLIELAAGDFVSAVPGEKRGKYYALKFPEGFKKLLAIERVCFADWQKVYDSLGILWDLVDNPRFARVSPATFQSELERVFEERLQVNFWFCRLKQLQELTSRNVTDLPQLLQTL